MKQKNIVALVGILVVSCAVLAMIRPASAAFLPFHGTGTWTICQGYNTTEIDHTDGASGTFALDLVTDPNPARGSYGCTASGVAGGEPIVAPVAGLIRHSVSGNGEFVCLQLDIPYGRIKSINFGHLDPSHRGYVAGAFDTRVEAGEQLGTLRRVLALAYGPAHLHMAAYANTICNGTTVPFDDFFLGHSFPALYDTRANLQVHQYYGTTISPTILPPTVVDGAGSLVDPTNQGTCASQGLAGCSVDYVQMHPHGVVSSGMFQVLSMPGYCEHVSISGLSKAYITVKRWSETYPGEQSDALSTIYFANSLPATVALPVSQWVLITVTSTAPVPMNETRRVSVACLQSAFPGGALTDLAPSLTAKQNAPATLLVPLQEDRFWSGSGSLITFSNNSSFAATRNGFGRTVDEAITLNTKKAVATFQVFSNGATCKNLYVIDSAGTTVQNVDVSYKLWNAGTWIPAGLKTLPALITLPSAGYWILKVKPSTVGWFKVRVTCG